MGKATKGRKMTFYPMAGGVSSQFAYLLRTLNFIKTKTPTENNLLQWMRHEFTSGKEFVRKAYQILFKGNELVRIDKNKCYLTQVGEELAITAAPRILLESFMKYFGGFDELFKVLIENKSLAWENLFDLWQNEVVKKYPSVKKWKRGYITSQLRYRVDWLRALGFIESITGNYLLTRDGLKMTLELRKLAAKSPDEAIEVSHHDLEEKIKSLGEFFQFEVRKRTSVNNALPPSAPKLRKKRQLDCLWVRTVHFAGKVQYPIEIQIAGNIADSIERLEMVANFVQKAIIITDKEQQEEIVDRLKAKRSSLLDKVVFIDTEDVDKIVEAATIMKTFTDKVFG